MTTSRSIALADQRIEPSNPSEETAPPRTLADRRARDGHGPHPASRGHVAPALLGRQREKHTLDQLMERVRAGRSGVLVVRGEAGIGKSALLGYMVGRASGCLIARAAGVESEMELAYAGLHQLCAPMLDLRERLPVPQGEALAAAFGLSAAPAPDPFVVGLAILGLLSEVAGERPLVCVIDDAQWLDRASAQIIGFVARRLLAEPVAVVCAARTGGDDVLAGLPDAAIEGLSDSDARALLLETVHGPLDAAVCDQIIAESHGNPLALLELPRTWNAADLAGGFGLPGSRPLANKIEESYSRRLDLLPSETQLLVLAAAAEPLGDPVLLDRASKALGVDMVVIDPAVDAGLIEIDGRIEFAHPLVRSAAYGSATADDRHRVHHALAEATDAETDPDRRAWHRARATPGPDEDVAVELERSASRAGARGGVAAEASFLRRAVALTADPARRAERALTAARASLQAGAFDSALRVLAAADAGPLDEHQRARVDLERAHVAFAHGDGDAPPLLLRAGRRLERFDVELARETYLVAWGAAATSGSLAGHDVLLEICRAVQALPRLGVPRPLDLLLDGLALLCTDGHAVAATALQRAAKVLRRIPVEDALRWGRTAASAAVFVWDFEGMHAICARQVQLARDAGALTDLSFHLNQLGMARQWLGDLSGAEVLVAEGRSVASAIGIPIESHTLLRLRALQGREAEASAAITSAVKHAPADGQATAPNAQWAAAILYNGLARYPEAAVAARLATSDAVYPAPSMWAWPELVEAAARAGDVQLARQALLGVSETTQPCRTDVALGIEARCRALLRDGAAADDLYREAIDRLSRTCVRPDLARTHLLYGEWLRREGRRLDAREQLRTALDMLDTIGMEAFAERARGELMATGEKVRKRRDDTRDHLTPQEEQIARLARDGLSNQEIGTKLFLSPRTVEWHLRKVFTKLHIDSRRQLRGKLLAHVEPAEIA